MCEFCGCEMGRSGEHPLQQRQPKGKALGVRVVAAPDEPKFSPPVTANSRDKTGSTLKEMTAERV